jgi:putative tryptophan/tyrosine transport system substrate-binding protein
MRRREFITLVSGVVIALPLSARAQQPAMPVVGYMNGGRPEAEARLLDAFRQGLNETGYIEGQNVRIDYRWAESQYDRLPGIAADLVRQQVTVIAATTTPAAVAAKAATATIPIVFETAGDPIRLGLVTSLNRPGGNVTGVAQVNSELVSKRLGLLHDLVPTATIIGLLVNPTDPRAETQTRDIQEAAQALGLQIQILNASTESEINTAFAKLAELQAGALSVGTGEARTTRDVGCPTENARDLSVSRLHCCWRSDKLRSEPYRCLSPSRSLHGSGAPGREARRHAGSATDQV